MNFDKSPNQIPTSSYIISPRSATASAHSTATCILKPKRPMGSIQHHGQLPNSPAASDSSSDADVANFLQALQLMAAFAVPTTIKAVVELGVLEVMANAGPGRDLSAAEIASKVSLNITNREGPEVLDRMLRYLASNSLLTCSVAEGEGGRSERRYGLTDVGRYFVESEDGTSIAPLLLMNEDKVLQEAWQELKYAFLEGAIPFQKAHGLTAFEYHGKDLRFNKVFNAGMHSSSNFIMRKVMDGYTGFAGLGKIVDVGGGTGATLRMIVSKYPHVKGVNFDLPHVVSDAPVIPGVEHVGGDMFDSVPGGDAIFMKWILHDWSDELCLKILKNCLKALPDSGKVIVAEAVIPETPDSSAATQTKLYGDMCMLTYNVGGKERTEREFEYLAKEAGFSGFKVAACVYSISVMEFLK